MKYFSWNVHLPSAVASHITKQIVMYGIILLTI